MNKHMPNPYDDGLPNINDSHQLYSLRPQVKSFVARNGRVLNASTRLLGSEECSLK